jgi:hypothetical protein
MKNIFQNEIKDSVLTALSANANYPASNLSHVFAKLKYKGLGYSDTITATFPDNITASGFFYTYTNAVSMTLRLYSNESVLLDTLAIDCTYSSGSVYFDTYTNVRWIELDIASSVSEDVYLGGIALGEAFVFPYPLADFDKGLTDNSGKTTSTDGQTSYHYVKPLLEYPLSFEGVSRDALYHSVVEQFITVGSGHIWVDITEENHDAYQPLYCTTSLIESPDSDMHIVSFKLTLTEAR